MSPSTVTHLLTMAHAKGNMTSTERMLIASRKRRADNLNKKPARRLGINQIDALEMLRATRDWHTCAVIAATLGKRAPAMHDALDGLVDQGLVEKSTFTAVDNSSGKESLRSVAHFRAKDVMA